MKVDELVDRIETEFLEGNNCVPLQLTNKMRALRP